MKDKICTRLVTDVVPHGDVIPGGRNSNTPNSERPERVEDSGDAGEAQGVVATGFVVDDSMISN
jgi:hypothetical protein